MSHHPYPIALVMIVRDEARCLTRCLASARDLVDEMLVVDTGSIDGSPEIARQNGARVEHLDWPDDFAAARNHALSLVDSPWRLVLDADEWIVGGTRCLDELGQQAPEFVGLVSIASQMMGDFDDLQWAPSWLPRVLPRGVVYEGRIHEQPVWSAARRRLDLQIEHDGYLPSQMELKRGRNRRLLIAELSDRPADTYISYQLGKDFEVNARFAEALPHFENAYQGTRSTPPLASWRHDLVLRFLYTLKKLGQIDRALALADVEQPNWSASPDFYFTLGDVLLDAAMAQPERAAQWLPRIEAAWLRAIEIGERPDLPDSLRGRGSFLAAHNLAAFHTALGHRADAELWRQRAASWRAAARPA